MLLNLRDVLASDRLAVDFDYTMDLSGEQFYAERPFRQPIRVRGSLADQSGQAGQSGQTGVFRLEAQVTAPVETHCARCGAPVAYQKELELSLAVVRGAGEQDAEDAYQAEGDSLDLDEIIREQLILNLEMTVLCKEDCKGLCPRCGQNLNLGDCGCQRAEPDPRLAKLQQLLKE